ncbi:phenylacetate--CoA ligase family protein [Iodidimonas sp. SYSU 1G8]|uniref:phenylacetate--CoA ligase family protein n=1 Tax=Iodidimonas sp. SYSU 1G8 TaxID=3133967 RepID=UPI0031FED022
MLNSYSQSLVWPALIDPSAAQVYGFLTQLFQTQWLKPDRLRELQSVQLAARLRHARETSAYFAPLLAGAEIRAATAFEVLGTLPLLTRADLQSRMDDIYTAAPKEHGDVWATSTSGSTGQPVTVRCTAAGYALRNAVMMRSLGWHKLDIRKRFGAIRASISVKNGVVPVVAKSWGKYVSAVYRTGEGIGLNIRAPIADQRAFLEKYKPDYLLTYPSNLQALVQEMPAPPGLRTLITIGETLPQELVDEVWRAWGIEIFDEYSSQELGSIAVQCEHHAYHCIPEAQFLEVLRDDGTPCGPGEIGRVVVTDLNNFATAMLRYEIRDYAEVGEPCACGRGSPVLKRIVGRVRNMLIMPDGSRVWPRFGLKQLGELAPIRQYQILQTERTRLEVNLASDRPLSADEMQAVAGRIRANTHQDFDVHVANTVGPLLKGANEKLEVFKCLI